MTQSRAPHSTNAWVLIPARGGSVGIPRKNLRLLGGIPLIAHTIRTSLSVLPPSQVIVVTDDDEIATVAEQWGATVFLETERTPPEETLDTKIIRNLVRLRDLGAESHDVVMTVQPTSPLIKAATLHEGLARFDTATVSSVVSVADDRHLRWQLNASGEAVPAFDARVNRQQLPPEFRETGGVIAARLGDIETAGTRVISPVSILQVADDEAVDIDTYADLYVAAHLLSRKRIAIRVDASTTLGMGHVYRMLAFVSELARHDIRIYLSDSLPLGQQFFSRYPYRFETVKDHADFHAHLQAWQPDLIVLDMLDTEATEVRALRAAAAKAQVITFEDRGSGANEADLLVAEFIENKAVPEDKQLTGIDYALLSPSFEVGGTQPARSLDRVSNVLVLFGGTDPSHLAERALASLAHADYSATVTVVRGLGAAPLDVPESLPYQLEIHENVTNMPALMSHADLAFTSAGRTIVELISCGVPSICLAQNEKELTHSHATADNGVLFLGLGTSVTDDDLDRATASMLEDQRMRAQFAERARAAGARRSNRRTISTILSRVGFDDFPDI